MSYTLQGLVQAYAIVTGQSYEKVSRNVQGEMRKAFEAGARAVGIDMRIDAQGAVYLGEPSLNKRISGKPGAPLKLQRMKREVSVFKDHGQYIVRRWDGGLKAFSSLAAAQQSSWLGQTTGDHLPKASMTLKTGNHGQVQIAYDPAGRTWLVTKGDATLGEFKFSEDTTRQEVLKRIAESRLLAAHVARQSQSDGNRLFAAKALKTLREGNLLGPGRVVIFNLFDSRYNPEAREPPAVVKIIGRVLDGYYRIASFGNARLVEGDRFTRLGMADKRAALIANRIPVDPNGLARVFVPVDAEGLSDLARRLVPIGYDSSDPGSIERWVRWAEDEKLPALKQALRNEIAIEAGFASAQALSTIASAAAISKAATSSRAVAVDMQAAGENAAVKQASSLRQTMFFAPELGASPPPVPNFPASFAPASSSRQGEDLFEIAGPRSRNGTLASGRSPSSKARDPGSAALKPYISLSQTEYEPQPAPPARADPPKASKHAENHFVSKDRFASKTTPPVPDKTDILFKGRGLPFEDLAGIPKFPSASEARTFEISPLNGLIPHVSKVEGNVCPALSDPLREKEPVPSR